jgi:hypothetical protein
MPADNSSATTALLWIAGTLWVGIFSSWAFSASSDDDSTHRSFAHRNVSHSHCHLDGALVLGGGIAVTLAGLKHYGRKLDAKALALIALVTSAALVQPALPHLPVTNNYVPSAPSFDASQAFTFADTCYNPTTHCASDAPFTLPPTAAGIDPILSKLRAQASARLATNVTAPVLRMCPDTQANVCLVPHISYLSEVTSYDSHGIEGVGSDLADVEAIGKAPFACLDKYGRLRHFTLTNAHVTPSCQDVLIGTNMNSDGFDFDSSNSVLTLPDGRQVNTPQGSDGMYQFSAIATAGGHDKANSSGDNANLAASFHKYNFSKQLIDQAVESDAVKIVEYHGGVGTASSVPGSAVEVIAYNDSDPMALELFTAEHPQAAVYSGTLEAIENAHDPHSFVSVAEHAPVAIIGIPCRNLITMNGKRNEQCADARQILTAIALASRCRHEVCIIEAPAALFVANNSRLYAQACDEIDAARPARAIAGRILFERFRELVLKVIAHVLFGVAFIVAHCKLCIIHGHA